MAILKYSIRFNLQHNNTKNKSTAIRCVVRFNNDRIVFGTNLKIDPKFWNEKTQSVKSTTSFDGSDIQNKLDSIKEFIDSEFDKFNYYPDAGDFKVTCKEFIVAEPPSVEDAAEERYLISYLDSLIAKMKSGDKRITGGRSLGQRYTDGTIRGYTTALNRLKSFVKLNGIKDISFDQVNKGFYDNLQSYFYNELKLSTNYFATVIKIIKSVMNNAREENLHTNIDFNSRYFLKPSYESDTIYLTIEQLEKIKNCELEEKHLQQARDLFLIGCWTGLRFSDFSTLNKNDIEGGFIRVLTEKTKERVSIPVHPVILEILYSNDGEFPKNMTNQRLNLYIKIIAKRAGLGKTVTVKKNRGGADVHEKIDFADLITTHTARRSFATNMFKMGIPTLVIMAITGHRTEVAFLRYIRVSNEEKANMMLEMWQKRGIFN